MTEDRIQFEIVQWYRNNYCLKTIPLADRGMIYSVPNGGSRNKAEAVKLKSTGLLSGVSDLIVILPSGRMLYVEVKTETGRQSDEQKEFEKFVTFKGYIYKIVRNLEEFKELILNLTA